MMMTRHHCQNWAALLIVLLGESFVIVAAISCYECNQFPTENRISCPANRTVNYGFQYDACVVYQLEDDRIVYQHGTPAASLNGACTKNITELAQLMMETFGAHGRAMCCKSNGCNVIIPRYIMANSSNPELFIESFRKTTPHNPTSSRFQDGVGASNHGRNLIASSCSIICLAVACIALAMSSY